MPELPEVEVVRRGLAPLLSGRRIMRIRASGLPLRAPLPLDRLRELACGARVAAVGRRAKFLLLPLDNGALILLHLGMTGKVYPATAATPARKHDHLVFHLGGQVLNPDQRQSEPAVIHNVRADPTSTTSDDPVSEIRFNDCRRFGLVAIYGPEEAAAPPLLAGLGPEPLEEGEFSPDYLLGRCRGRKTPIKNLLMDNRVVVGIGNIYANEVLFAAGISPFTPAGEIDRARAEELVLQAGTILTKAIAAGGSTIADFANAAGESGYFQLQLAVYGRAGTPCPRCGDTITRQLQAGRPSFYCPRCQRCR